MKIKKDWHDPLPYTVRLKKRKQLGREREEEKQNKNLIFFYVFKTERKCFFLFTRFTHTLS